MGTEIMAEIYYPRFKTREVRVGDVTLGGDNPVVVQSMVTEETKNVAGVVSQVINLYRAGAGIVRVTVPTLNDLNYLREIKEQLKSFQLPVGLSADVHHQGSRIATEAAKYADKVRINPGLFVDHGVFEGFKEDYTEDDVDQRVEEIDKALKPVIASCKENGTAIRIGVNHGSLSNRMKVLYGDTPDGMVESAMEYIKICKRYRFDDLIISLKASNVPIMVEANRLLIKRMKHKRMHYPIHLGVTEAGDGQYARIKSASGIATLLMEGIGDTIRVSLSEDPVKEIPVCFSILQATRRLITETEYIACPSCGRTKFNLPSVLTEVKQYTSHLKNLTIAVMGCIVNGPGEMADSDYGYVGEGGGKITLYRKKEIVKRGIPQESGLDELINLLKQDGVWREP